MKTEKNKDERIVLYNDDGFLTPPRSRDKMKNYYEVMRRARYTTQEIKIAIDNINITPSNNLYRRGNIGRYVYLNILLIDV